MSRTQALGDDHVQTIPDHFFRRVTEHRFRTRIPQPSHALPVGKDDRARDLSTIA